MDITLSANMYHCHVLEKKLTDDINFVISLETEQGLPNKLNINEYTPNPLPLLNPSLFFFLHKMQQYLW